ncbi:MAG: GGDEF domain-containing protein [Pseudomonadota bacterium]
MPLPSLLPADTRSPGMRGLIACAGSFIAFSGFWLVHAYARHDPDAGRFYDAVVLDLMQQVLAIAMGTALAIGIWCWRVRHERGENPLLTSTLTVTMSLGFMLLGVAYGFYTTPMGFVIMGVLAFGLVFFDRRAVLSGIVACLAVFIGNEVLIAQGWVDYAPLLSRSLFEGDGTQLSWWWGVHLRVILYVAFFAFFALLMFQLDQLEAQRRALAELAVTDPLTGVANRRRFGERLDEEVQRRNRSGRPFCVLLCDADHFKKVNDSYGHHAGDVVIRHIAGVLADSVRAQIDVVGRLGGEEFGVLLPETGLPGAREIAERVLAQMRAHEFRVEGHRFRVTLSIGIAESAGGSGDDALRTADANLYRAKEGGRDRLADSVQA